MQEPISLKISLPKIPDIELVALEGLDRLARHLGIAEEKIGEARIVVTEAIINAFEHAAAERPSVDVEYTMTPKELVVFVRDYGRGFDPGTVETPDLSKKLTSESKRGWGLHLMKTLSDGFDIQSSSQGTRITIKKLLS